MPTPKPGKDQRDIIQAIQRLIDGFKSGEMHQVAMRIHKADGSWEEILVGFEDDQDRDEAIARLRKLLGQLH